MCVTITDMRVPIDTFLVAMRLAAAEPAWTKWSIGRPDAAVVAFTSRHPVSGQDLASDFDLFIRLPDAREQVFGAAHRR